MITDFSLPLTIGTLNIPAQPDYCDDARKMSNSWKASGLAWMYTAARVTPKKFRQTMICSCNSHLYPMIKLSHLSEEWTDFMAFAVFGLNPDAKVQDWGCDTKRQIRTAAREQYISRLQKNASRLDALSE